jgi:hypothetical protein
MLDPDVFHRQPSNYTKKESVRQHESESIADPNPAFALPPTWAFKSCRTKAVYGAGIVVANVALKF